MKEKPRWLKTVFAVIVFWAFFFLGGAVAKLFFLIQEWIAPSFFLKIPKVQQIVDTVLNIICSPIGVLIGYALYSYITGEEFSVGLLVNCVIGATFALVVFFISLFVSEIPSLISQGLMIAVLIYAAVSQGIGLKKAQ